MEELSAYLHSRRLALGLSFRQMARACGLSVSMIYELEAGTIRLPRRDTVHAIAKGYGIDAEDVVLHAYGLPVAAALSGHPARAVDVAAV
jgi:transcriptional regulator with XRE-family HTH domain